MALEKPLGSDLESSREINDAVAAAFPEDRTFRIDHYLGKETVQNLLALRFANLMFEPLWNSAHIDHVQITVAETIGLEGRGDYYDQAGALRDMVQNHMLQLARAGRDGAAERFQRDRGSRREGEGAARASADHRRGCRGETRHRPIHARRDRWRNRPRLCRGDRPRRATPRRSSPKAHIDNWRWKGVPFYLRTGKRMPTRDTEIFIQFQDVPYSIFASRGATTQPNKLIIGLQPEETISCA